jgi:two-component system, chemotaxis family, sensor kinase CheA
VEEFLGEFLDEADEMTVSLAASVSELAENPGNDEVRNNAYRCVHVIRGGAGFLGLVRVERLAAAGERLLGRIAAGELEPTGERLRIVSELGLALRGILEGAREHGSEQAGDDGELVAAIEAAAQP